LKDARSRPDAAGQLDIYEFDRRIVRQLQEQSALPVCGTD